MKFKSNLKAVIKANKMSMASFKILCMLERLGIQAAIYVHQEEVREYADRFAEKHYIATMEIFGDYGPGLE